MRWYANNSYATLIKSAQITHNTNDLQYSNKHATTKVILCKDPESFAFKGKHKFYQFSTKRIRTQTKTCNYKYQDSILTCNKEYSFNEGWTQHKTKNPLYCMRINEKELLKSMLKYLCYKMLLQSTQNLRGVCEAQ